MALQVHPSTTLIPPHQEEAVLIDNAMIDLVRAIWARRWQTAACCQDTGEAVEAERNAVEPVGEPTGNAGFIEYYRGWAWLKMPRGDALALLSDLATDDQFREFVTTRWAQGSWRLHTPVVWTGERFTTAAFVQVYFPSNQIIALTKALIPDE
ncbi:hypothetical protein ACQEU6_30075 [Spirillospora sp. CA-108201]